MAKKEKESGQKGQAANPFASMFSLFAPEDLEKLGDMNSVLRDMGAVSLRQALEARLPVRYAAGCGITDPDTSGFAAAVQAARESDVAVLALGGNCGWVNVTGGEGKDRSSLELPGVQQQLLEAVAATGKPVVVVLYGPGCFAIPWAAEHAGAILQAWMPGPAAGLAVADVLDGTENPGGKLPVTVPRSVGQVPIYYNHKVGSGYTDGSDGMAAGIFSGGYVNEPGTPLYPFGFGLSYTSFALDELKLDGARVPTDGRLTVSCRVTNTGSRAGSEVVQLYTHFLDAHVTRPNKSLGGFARVWLQPGESRKVTFRLSMAQLGYYNENMDFVTEPGELQVMVGTSAHDLPLRTSVQLVGQPAPLLGRRVYSCPASVE